MASKLCTNSRIYLTEKRGKVMNKKWSEKTTFEKTMDIISGIAICVWLIFEMLERKNVVPYAGIASSISIWVVCICEAMAYWNVKRSFSYVAIAGAALLKVVTVLQILWA